MCGRGRWERRERNTNLLFHLFMCSLVASFFKDFIYLFLGGGGKEKERDKNINMWEKHHVPPSRDLAHNPGICPDCYPDWKSNQWPFSLQDNTNPLSYTSKGHWLLFVYMYPKQRSNPQPLHTGAMLYLSYPTMAKKKILKLIQWSKIILDMMFCF